MMVVMMMLTSEMEAMVQEVNMALHDPEPGNAVHSIAFSSSIGMSPFPYEPIAFTNKKGLIHHYSIYAIFFLQAKDAGRSGAISLRSRLLPSPFKFLPQLS